MTESYFDELAPKWERVRESFYSSRVRERAIAAAHVEPGRVAADIGAGTGFMAEGLLMNGLKVIAVDESEMMLSELKKRLQGSGVTDCRRGSAEKIPIEDERVDYVFANMLLHHVEMPPRAIGEMVRILKPGGVLVITDLEEHHFEFLRTEQRDRWMGFHTSRVAEWFGQAGLADVRIESVGENCCASSGNGKELAAVKIFLASGKKPS